MRQGSRVFPPSEAICTFFSRSFISHLFIQELIFFHIKIQPHRVLNFRFSFATKQDQCYIGKLLPIFIEPDGFFFQIVFWVKKLSKMWFRGVPLQVWLKSRRFFHKLFHISWQLILKQFRSNINSCKLYFGNRKMFDCSVLLEILITR